MFSRGKGGHAGNATVATGPQPRGSQGGGRPTAGSPPHPQGPVAQYAPQGPAPSGYGQYQQPLEPSIGERDLSPGGQRQRPAAVPVAVSSYSSHPGSSASAPSAPRGGGNAEHLAVMQQQAGAQMLQISVCGRTVELPATVASTVQAVRAALQRELGMPGQEFEVMDVHGERILTDGDLSQALSQGRMPLVASLHEASIHYIENRREELSQMQWKLVRDQLSGLTDKVMQLGRRVHELGESLQDTRQNMESDVARSREEMVSLSDAGREFTRQSILQTTERIDAVSHLLNSERNLREASRQGLERQLQALRDLLESDKSNRRAEITTAHAMLEDMRKSITEDQRKREALEDLFHQGQRAVNERIDALARMHSDVVQDHSEQARVTEMKFNQEMQEHVQLGLKARTEMEAHSLEAQAACRRSEDRIALLESRMQEFMHKQAIHNSQHIEQKEKLSQAMENFRIEERGRGLAMRNMLGRMGELEERSLRQADKALESGLHAASETRSRSTGTPRGRSPDRRVVPPVLYRSPSPATVVVPSGQRSPSGSLSLVLGSVPGSVTVAPRREPAAEPSTMCSSAGASTPTPAFAFSCQSPSTPSISPSNLSCMARAAPVQVQGSLSNGPVGRASSPVVVTNASPVRVRTVSRVNLLGGGGRPSMSAAAPAAVPTAHVQGGAPFR